MDTLLGELYFKFGKRNPKKHDLINAQIIEKCEKELRITLNAKQLSLLIDLIDAYDEMQLNMSINNFKCGVLLGAKLYKELQSETYSLESDN